MHNARLEARVSQQRDETVNNQPYANRQRRRCPFRSSPHNQRGSIGLESRVCPLHSNQAGMCSSGRSRECDERDGEMRKVFVSQSLVEVESRKDLLDKVGISNTIRNQQSSTLAGAVPFAEVFPELWVLRDEDYDQAMMVMEEKPQRPGELQADWVCGRCGETHGHVFSECWKCGQKQSSNSSAGARSVHAADLEVEGAPQRHTSSTELLVGVLIGICLSAIAYWAWSWFSVTRTPYDRNADGRDDLIYEYVGRVLRSAKSDNNFDGFYETFSIFNNDGDVIRTEIDRNRDGKADVIEYNTLGKLDSMDIIDPTTGKVRKRMFYKLDVKVREEIDHDGDGIFERVVAFDEYENPLP